MLQRWYNLFILIAVFSFFLTIWLVTLFTLPFMILCDFYRLMTMKDSYTVHTSRFLLHKNTHLYPLDFVYLHLWSVPSSISWSVCVHAKENCRESGGILLGSRALCMFYNLVVTFVQMMRLRTSYWLVAAPLRVILNISGYQATEGVPLTSVWFAYVFYEENHKGWL